MGDYLEEILDSNDSELELMAALDDSEWFGEAQYKELFIDDELLYELDNEELTEK